MFQKNILLIGLFSSILLQPLLAQTGKVFDNLTLHSEILGKERKYAVYLPPDYETSERSYPVLYLLHGAGDDQTGWVQFGEVQYIADKTILSGKATPMVIIMPDAKTERLGYFNQIGGEWNYEDFFFKEFIPYVEEKYRVKGEKRYRAISGLSMGGGGTFMYALRHPELFSSAAPLSAYIGPLSLEEMKRGLGDHNYDEEEILNYFNKHNAISLINSLPEDHKEAVRWYIDCGDDDFLYEGNSLVHISMKKAHIPHEFRIRNGGHTWTYWRESLPAVLEFISQAFHQY